MGLDYVGELPLGVMCSASLSAVAGISASLSLVLPQIAIDLEAALQCSLSLGISPPNLAVDIEFAINLIADLNLALSVSLPSIDFQITAILTLIATISPIIASLSFSLSLSLPLAELFATAGIQAYSFSGQGNQFGTLMGSSIGEFWPDGTPATEDVVGFILASTSPAGWVGLQDFFTCIPATQGPGTVDYIGGISIGAMVGGLSAGILSANLQLNFQFGQFSAELAGALALSASLHATPPSIAGSLTIALNLKASLEAYLSLGGFILPTAAITAILDLVIQLRGLVASVTAQISLMATLTAQLSVTGILAYSYSGTGAAMGPAISTALATQWPDSTPGTDPSNAVIFVATESIGAAGLSTFFIGL
jgi:hypothetical protein